MCVSRVDGFLKYRGGGSIADFPDPPPRYRFYRTTPPPVFRGMPELPVESAFFERISQRAFDRVPTTYFFSGFAGKIYTKLYFFQKSAKILESTVKNSIEPVVL